MLRVTEANDLQETSAVEDVSPGSTEVAAQRSLSRRREMLARSFNSTAAQLGDDERSWAGPSGSTNKETKKVTLPAMTPRPGPSSSVGKRMLYLTSDTRGSGRSRSHTLASRASVMTNNLQATRTSDTAADHQLDSEIRRNFGAIEHLTQELDTLFAEMGKQIVSAKPGQRLSLRLPRGTVRTIDVKLHRAQEEAGKEATVQIDCNLHESSQHARADYGSRKKEDEPIFDVQVADAHRHISTGPYVAQSAGKATHRLRLCTESGNIYINLSSLRFEVHVELTCRVLLGAAASSNTATGRGPAVSNNDTRATYRDDDDILVSPSDATGLTTRIGRQLEAKLRYKRQTAPETPRGPSSKGGQLQQKSAQPTISTQAAQPLSPRVTATLASAAASVGAVGFQTHEVVRKQGRLFADFGVSLQDGQDVCRHILTLWLGPSGKYFSNRRSPKGSWVKSLSREFAKKMISNLRKIAQDRNAMVMVATTGAFVFFLNRQRELHLARGRTALRQLVWYKALFAASRLRFCMVFVGTGREARKQLRHIKLDTSNSPEKVRRRSVSRSVTLSKPGESKKKSQLINETVEMVQHYCAMFERGPRSKANATSAIQMQISDDSVADPVLEASGSKEAVRSKSCITRMTSEIIRAGSILDEELQRRLIRQGFVVRPTAEATASGRPGRGGGRQRVRKASFHSRRSLVASDISEALGHAIEFSGPPPIAFNEELEEVGDLDLKSAMREVNSNVLLMTVRPDEISKVESSRGGANAEGMSNERFRRFHLASTRRAAEALLRKRALQAEIDSGERIMPVKITKRYLLQFFEEYVPELPWLELLQNMMLVIQGGQFFQTSHERQVFETRLRAFNEARKIAMRKPGAFAPIEAALWSHPLIVGLAAGFQRTVVYGLSDSTSGDSALAWKSSLFTGSVQACESASGRDIDGTSLVSGVHVDGIDGHRIRKLAEISGQFLSTTKYYPDDAAPLDWTPTCLSTTTSSGHPVRAFGYDLEGPKGLEKYNVIRHQERALDIGQETKPRELRIEDLKLQRQTRTSSESPRNGNDLIAHSDLKAQERYHQWMMRSVVPEKAQQFKQGLQSYFESLASDENSRSTLSVDRTLSKSLRLASSIEGELMEASMSVHVDSASVTLEDSQNKVASAGAKASESETMEPVLSIRSHVSTQPIGDSTQSAQSKRNEARGLGYAGGLPQTVAEIRKLIENSNALETILSIDADQLGLGGFAQRCSAGWNSGYREAPMTKDEIRRVRIVENCMASSHRKGMGRNSDNPVN